MLTLTRITSADCYKFLKTMSQSIATYKLQHYFEASLNENPVQTKLTQDEFLQLCEVLCDKKYQTVMEKSEKKLKSSLVASWLEAVQDRELLASTEEKLVFNR